MCLSGRGGVHAWGQRVYKNKPSLFRIKANTPDLKSHQRKSTGIIHLGREDNTCNILYDNVRSHTIEHL